MYVVNGDIKYQVKWVHVRTEGFPEQTRCTILKFQDGKDEEIFSQAHAICSRKDNFSKSIGRKVSMRKSLMKFTNKNLRRTFWTTYLNSNIK